MRGKRDRGVLDSIGQGLDIFGQLIGWIFVAWLVLSHILFSSDFI